ncbi:MAG: prepilin-type N-terminal cleavage/methylation domain-containing protein [Desulfocapsa sp.]|nr:prepilin-type N-terminal cleavage/methylation domain-containing protein [Desulfocapsa sp.]
MKDSGFTLLEVMIAMAILGIALTSLFGSQSASVALATETRFNIQAPLLAKMQLATIRSGEEVFDGSGDFGEDFPGFQWELTVEDAFFPESEILVDLDEKLQHLTLIITWGEELFSYQVDSYQRSKE